MGDLGQITSLWALVSPFTKRDFWVRVLGCVDVKPIPRIQIWYPPTPTAWLQLVQMPRAVGWGKALPHWGAAGTWGAERRAPNPQGSAANEGESTFSLYMGAGFKPPHLLALNKCLRKGLCGCPTQRGAGPSTWQPSRVVTEGGWFQPPRAVSMVTGTEPSWAFEERS